MGLGGGRKRVKIGHDPNNETWARQTTNYGHRMLVSQGWAPGKVLGAADNSYYSEHHLTDASHSHIKVALREDNLGLGAKKGSGVESGECVGLDAFQALLGRLNGKSDETLEKEQRSRDDLKRSRYMERRGLVRFVAGGTLVSDMDELIELARRSRIDMGLESESGAKIKPKKESKKDRRKTEKAVVEDESESKELEQSSDKKKKSKKRKKREAEAGDSDTIDQIATVGKAAITTSRMEVVEIEPIGNSDGEEDDETRKARRKAEKAEKRERKQRRREEKAARKAAATEPSSSGSIVKEVQSEPVTKETLVLEPVTEKTTAKQQETFGRHASVRSRYIAAKRRALMDPQALKEILMARG